MPKNSPFILKDEQLQRYTGPRAFLQGGWSCLIH